VCSGVAAALKLPYRIIKQEKEKKKEKEKEKEKERSSKKAEKEGGDVQTKASTDAATSQSDDKKDKPEAGSAKDGSDGPPATKPTLKGTCSKGDCRRKFPTPKSPSEEAIFSLRLDCYRRLYAYDRV
jgi:hypothetical protein